MTRQSRFDKLESVREEKPAEARTVNEQRFAQGLEAPGAGEAAPADGAEGPALTRFEADGAQHVSLDTDALARLPMLRCPECSRDSSKFDVVCLFCQTSLTTPAARAFNLDLLATADAEHEAQREAQQALRQRQLEQVAEAELQRQVALQKPLRLRDRWGKRLALWAGAVACGGLGLAAGSAGAFCGSVVFFTVGLALVVAALPPEALTALSTSIKPRGRW